MPCAVRPASVFLKQLRQRAVLRRSRPIHFSHGERFAERLFSTHRGLLVPGGWDSRRVAALICVAPARVVMVEKFSAEAGGNLTIARLLASARFQDEPASLASARGADWEGCGCELT